MKTVLVRMTVTSEEHLSDILDGLEMDYEQTGEGMRSCMEYGDEWTVVKRHELALLLQFKDFAGSIKDELSAKVAPMVDRNLPVLGDKVMGWAKRINELQAKLMEFGYNSDGSSTKEGK